MLDRSISSYQPDPNSISPKIVTSQISPDFQESPLAPLRLPSEASLTVSFQKAVIIGAGLFFLGAFLAVIVMLLIY